MFESRILLSRIAIILALVFLIIVKVGQTTQITATGRATRSTATRSRLRSASWGSTAGNEA